MVVTANDFISAFDGSSLFHRVDVGGDKTGVILWKSDNCKVTLFGTSCFDDTSTFSICGLKDEYMYYVSLPDVSFLSVSHFYSHDYVMLVVNGHDIYFKV